MIRNRCLPLLCFAAGLSAVEAQASNLAQCRIAVAEASLAINRVHHNRMSSCVKFGNFSDCNTIWHLVNAVTGPFDADLLRAGEPCYEALETEGIPAVELHYGIEIDSWFVHDDLDYFQIYDDDLGDNYAYNQQGLHDKLRYDIDFPDEAPASTNARKCIRSMVAGIGKVVRTGMLQQIACAKADGEPPWNCPIDTSEDSRLGKSLLSLDRRIGKCRDDAGVAGAVGDDTAKLCNTAVASTDDLAACVRKAALCQICSLSVTTLDTDHDCKAISGDRECDPTYGMEFGKIPAGSSFVANEGGDSVTRLSELFDYAGSDLASSTVAVGDGPVGVAISERTGVVASIDRGSNSVTLLLARDGSYANGSQPASTIPVGTSPSAGVVHPDRDILYVANEGDDSVTFLDAYDGSYVFGTLAASTFPAGNAPSSLAVSASLDILYVANSGDGTVSFLDAGSGLPLYGTLASSTFAASFLSYSTDGTQHRLLVANEGSATVTLLDGQTGSPADGSLAASQRSVGAGPLAVAGYDWFGFNLYAASSGTPSITALREDTTAWPTNSGEIASVTVPLSEAPGGMVLAPALPHYNDGPPARLLVTAPASDRAYAVPLMTPWELAGPADAERSMFTVPPNPLFVAAAETRSGFYIIWLDAVQNADPLRFVDADGVVQWEVPVPLNVNGLAYSEATDTVYVGTPTGTIYIDGGDGSFRFGDQASSTFSCGCNGVPRLVDDTTGLLYVRCTNGVAFLDTADGSCPTLAQPAISPGTGRVSDIAVDPVANTLYLVFSYYTGFESRLVVVRHDATTGAWKNGTYEDSILSSEVGDYGSSAEYARIDLSADGASLYMLLFRSSGLLSRRDASTGAVLATRDLREDTYRPVFPQWFHVGSGGDPLVAFRMVAKSVLYDWYQYGPTFDDAVYLDPLTLDFVNGSLDSSRLLLGVSNRITTIFPNFASHAGLDVLGVIAYDAIDPWDPSCCENIGGGLILIDPSTPAFARSMSTEDAGAPIPTGDHPLGIAAMPDHTQLSAAYD
jgi:DNA-binding beta-propeller fold protein YncE